MSSIQQPPATTAPEPPPQHQPPPGLEAKMQPQPVDEDERYRGSGKLEGKVAIVTGGDSGIGRAVAIAFAKEGADVAIVHLETEDLDAQYTLRRVSELGRRGLGITGDLARDEFATEAVERTVRELGRLDIVVNNAAEQHVIGELAELAPGQFEQTLRTNLVAYFNVVRAALPHLQPGSAIINTTSVQAYEPEPSLLDYACTKAGIVNLTRALAKKLVNQGIRVNAVAPGPVWTPLITASFSAEKIPEFGKRTPMARPAQPAEMAPSFVFLASNIDSSYMTGQVLHPNGGAAMVS